MKSLTNAALITILMATMEFAGATKLFAQTKDLNKDSKNKSKTELADYMVDFQKYMHDFYGGSENKGNKTYLKPFAMYDLHSSQDLTDLDDVMSIVWKYKNKNFNPEKIDPFSHTLSFRDVGYGIEVDVLGDINNDFKKFIIDNNEDKISLRGSLKEYSKEMNLEIVMAGLKKKSNSEMQAVIDELKSSNIVYLNDNGNLAIKANAKVRGGPESIWGIAYLFGQKMGKIGDGPYTCNDKPEELGWLVNTVQKILSINPQLKDKNETTFVKHYMEPENVDASNKIITQYVNCYDQFALPDSVSSASELNLDQRKNLLEKATDYWLKAGDEIVLDIAPLSEEFGTKFDLEALIDNIGLAFHRLKFDLVTYTNNQVDEAKTEIKKEVDVKIKNTEERINDRADSSYVQLAKLSLVQGTAGIGLSHNSVHTSNVIAGTPFEYDMNTLFAGFEYALQVGLGKGKTGFPIAVFTYKTGEFKPKGDGKVKDIDGKEVGFVLNSSSRQYSQSGVELNLGLWDNLELNAGVFKGEKTDDMDIKYYSTVGQSHIGGDILGIYLGGSFGELYGPNIGLFGGYEGFNDEREPTQFTNVGGYPSNNKLNAFYASLAGQIPVGTGRLNAILGYSNSVRDRVVNDGIAEDIENDVLRVGLMYSIGNKVYMSPLAPGAFGAPGGKFGIFGDFNAILEKGIDVTLGMFGNFNLTKDVSVLPFATYNYNNATEVNKTQNSELTVDRTNQSINAGFKIGF